jgi:hypothetical protein
MLCVGRETIYPCHILGIVALRGCHIHEWPGRISENADKRMIFRKYLNANAPLGIGSKNGHDQRPPSLKDNIESQVWSLWAGKLVEVGLAICHLLQEGPTQLAHRSNLWSPEFSCVKCLTKLLASTVPIYLCRDSYVN